MIENKHTDRLKMRPNFWKDDIWFIPVFIFLFQFEFCLFFSELGKSGLVVSFVMFTILIDPIFLLIFIAEASRSVVFEDEKLILKGFLSRKEIYYKDITQLDMVQTSYQQVWYWPHIRWVDPKRNKLQDRLLPIWRHGIHALVQEIFKRTGLSSNIPDEILKKNAKKNRNGKILIICTYCLPLIILYFAAPLFPKTKLKSVSPALDPHCFTRYKVGLSDNDLIDYKEQFRFAFSANNNATFKPKSDIFLYVITNTTEPRCKTIRVDLKNEAGTLISSRFFEVPAVQDKDLKLGSFNPYYNLSVGKYSINAFYENQLIKKLDFTIK